MLDGDDMDAGSPTEPTELDFDSMMGYFGSEPDDDDMSEAESLTELDFDSMLGYCESEFDDDHMSLDSESEPGDDALPTYTAKSDDEHKAIKSEPASGVIELTTESSTGSPAPFRLLDLPDRVRLQVYGYIMTTPNDVILRLPSEMRNFQRPGNPPVNIFPGIAILRICNKVYSEAAPIFYTNNRFHYETDMSLRSWPEKFSQVIYMMAHISLGYTDDYPANQPLTSTAKFSRTIDHKLSNMIKVVYDQVPNLRSFTFYIFSTPGPNTIHLCPLDKHQKTGLAIFKIRSRVERLTIVSIDNCEDLPDSLGTIACWTEWSDNRAQSWPRTSLPDRKRLAIEEQQPVSLDETFIHVSSTYNTEVYLAGMGDDRALVKWKDDMVLPRLHPQSSRS